MSVRDLVYGSTWRKIRLAVLDRDGHICQIRGPKCLIDATDVDHIVPWRAGGAFFDPSNLRAACGPCNRGRGKRDVARRPSREW